MEIHAIAHHDREKKPDVYQSTWAYQEFFHGETAYGHTNRYGKRPYKSFPLIRNIRLMPKVFFASIWMVVDAEVAAELKQFNGIDLVECEWESVYDYPVDEPNIRTLLNRFSVFTEEFGEWIKAQYKQPGLQLRERKYFQVVAQPFDAVAQQFTRGSSVSLPGPVYEPFPPFITSAMLHQQYPILKLTPYYLYAPAVFDILRPHVSDPSSFKVHSFEAGP